MSAAVWIGVFFVVVMVAVIVVVLLTVGRAEVYRDEVARVRLEPGKETVVTCTSAGPPTWLWLAFSMKWRDNPRWELRMRMAVYLGEKQAYQGEFELRHNSGTPLPRRGVLGFGGEGGHGLSGYSVTDASKQLAVFDIPAGVPVRIHVTATPAFAMDQVDLALVVASGKKAVVGG